MEVWSCARAEGGPLGACDQEPGVYNGELRMTSPDAHPASVTVPLVLNVDPESPAPHAAPSAGGDQGIPLCYTEPYRGRNGTPALLVSLA